MDIGSIELFLFDIDGVFLAGKRSPTLVSGRRVLPELRRRGLPFRLVTNTSTDPPQVLVDTLARLGVEVRAEEIHSALTATVRAAVRRFPQGRCFVVGEDGLRQAAEAAGLRPVSAPPAELVLLGLSRQVDYELLSHAARCLKSGAALLGCHRNRMWLDDDGPALSCGPWLAALEHATGVSATVYGKPERAFFEAALAPFEVAAARTLMVGDDLEADIAGAQQAGLQAALALTGKTNREALAGLRTTPDLVLAQVDDLVEMLP